MSDRRRRPGPSTLADRMAMDSEGVVVVERDPEDTPERRLATLDAYPEWMRPAIRADAERALKRRVKGKR